MLFPTANNPALLDTTMKLLRISLATLAAMIHVVTVNAADQPSTWPQWRGPQRDGLVTGPKWPAQLAIADDALFMRELNALAAYRWREDNAATVSTTP